MKKRVLFLMSDTGGGHRAAAQAIEEAIHYLYPNRYDTFIEDLWRAHTPWPVNKIPNSYPWLIGRGQSLWKLMWSGSARTKGHKLMIPSISPIVARKVLRYLRAINPDIVVSVHPFMNHLGQKWLKKLGWKIPFVTVVTDMVTIHPLWICPGVTRCLVPTGEAKEIAIKFGMPGEKIEICGQPIGLKFADLPGSKAATRQKLTLDPNRQTVLVMGGGEGYGRVYDVARMLAQTTPQAQLLIVTGRNQTLKNKMENVTWEIPTHIFGFVENIPELMNAADILITKAGPGTISEAFAMGLPPLICGYIPGQEKGNVAYVQKHRAGAYAEDPIEIARLVQNWLDPDTPTLQELAQNAARLARPEASLTIAAKICGLIEDQPIRTISQTAIVREETGPTTRSFTQH